jgi:hypothetical protein
MRLNRPSRKRRTVRRNKAKSSSVPFDRYHAKMKRARALGFKGGQVKEPVLDRWLAAKKAKPSKKRITARRKPGTGKRRKLTVRGQLSTAKRKLSGRRKTSKMKGRSSVKTQLNQLARRVQGADKSLARAIRAEARKRGPSGRRKARKNPGIETGLKYIGGGLAGIFIGNLGINLAHSAANRMSPGPSEVKRWGIGIGVPLGLAAITHVTFDKVARLKDHKDLSWGIIGGLIGGAVARQIPAFQQYIAGTWAEKVFSLGAGTGAGQYYAGAAGLGRYITSGALGNTDYADDLYAGQAGVGRYMLDDTAFHGSGLVTSMNGLGEVKQAAAGIGEYVSEPAVLEGLGATGDDMDELMDDLGSVPVLTPDEEQAENILIPELAYEALQGLHGHADGKSTFRASNPNMPVIRTTPGLAAKVQQANIGQILGESSQVPGTILVASSVAGRDIMQTGGPMIPSQHGAFRNKAIEPASNISIQPYGVFSAGVFTTTLPVHGRISR